MGNFTFYPAVSEEDRLKYGGFVMDRAVEFEKQLLENQDRVNEVTGGGPVTLGNGKVHLLFKMFYDEMNGVKQPQAKP